MNIFKDKMVSNLLFKIMHNLGVTATDTKLEFMVILNSFKRCI